MSRILEPQFIEKRNVLKAIKTIYSIYKVGDFGLPPKNATSVDESAWKESSNVMIISVITDIDVSAAMPLLPFATMAVEELLSLGYITLSDIEKFSYKLTPAGYSYLEECATKEINDKKNNIDWLERKQDKRWNRIVQIASMFLPILTFVLGYLLG